MILLLLLLSVIDLSIGFSRPDPLASPIFILSCKADGPVHTANVSLNMTNEIINSLQSIEVHVNCSNGHRDEERSYDDSEYKFEIPADEIYCTAIVTYFDFYYGTSLVSNKNCEFPVPVPTVSVGVVGSEIVGSSVSLECNITTVNGINDSVDIIWTRDDGEEVLTENDVVGRPVNSRGILLHTSLYNITVLQMIDNDTTYYCHAVINTSPLVNNSDNYTLNVFIPAPEVTITRVLSPLSLRCNVITVMGISTLDIVWMKDDAEILRNNDAVGGPINNATLMLYTSHYDNITMPNDNIMYSCQAIINANLMVNSSDNYTLHWTDFNQTTVTPSYTSTVMQTTIASLITTTPSSATSNAVVHSSTVNSTPTMSIKTSNTDYHQITVIVALVGLIFTVIIVLLIFGLFLCKNRSKLFMKLTNSQDKHMDLCNFEDTDYSVIGIDKESTCEYLENNNKFNVSSWIDNISSKLQKLDEECSECTTKEVMLNCIHGFPETDTDTQHVASDIESHHDLDIPERRIKDAGYAVTSNKQDDTSHGNTDNGARDCAVLQQDVAATPSYIYENGIHKNSDVNVQRIAPTLQNKSSSSYVKIVPDLQACTIKTQDDNFTYTSQEIMKVAYPVTSIMPSASCGNYIHYTAAINPSNTEIEGDYVDYHIGSADQQPTLPNFQNTDHSILHLPLHDKANTMQPAQSIYVDSEMIDSTNYLVDPEMEGGQCIDYDSAVQQGIGQLQGGMNADTNM